MSYKIPAASHRVMVKPYCHADWLKGQIIYVQEIVKLCGLHPMMKAVYEMKLAGLQRELDEELINTNEHTSTSHD